MSRMRRPEEIRLELPPPDNDWLLVKKHLTAGEYHDIQARTVGTWESGQRPQLNFKEIATSMLLSYLLDWSMQDPDGRPVVIRDQPETKVRKALEDLDPEKFAEMKEAVEAHHAAMEALREAEKKGRVGATASSTTSASVV